jgi:hypothetical protein
VAEAHKGPRDLFKVAFDLERLSDRWPPFAVERIWAKKTLIRGRLELANTPFFVRGVAQGDIIEVHPDSNRRELVFDRVAQHLGNSTVRIVINDDAARSPILALFEEFGASLEFSSAPSHLAATIPISADYASLRPRLVSMKDSGLIGVEEAFVSDHHQRQLA